MKPQTPSQRVNQSLRRTAMLLDRFMPDRMPSCIYGNHSNDNRGTVKMTGDFGRDGRILQRKWDISDVQYLSWAHSFNGVSEGMNTGAADAGKRMMTLHNLPMEAAMTAICIGAVNTLFAYLGNLPDAEAIFVLDEIARQTDKTVRDMTNKGRKQHEQA